jgi:hypothetical protein
LKADEMSDETAGFEAFPFSHRLPISRAFPFYYRWKILQLKLSMNDLLELEKKHNITAARALYEVLREEAEYTMEELTQKVKEKREKINAKIIEVSEK